MFQSLSDIGSVGNVFNSDKGNLVAGVILCALMIARGFALCGFTADAILQRNGALPVYDEDGESSWALVSLTTALSIGAVVGGLYGLCWFRKNWSMCVHVGEHGFAVSRRSGLEVFLWNEIERVIETRRYERPPLLKGPAKFLLPVIESKSYPIRRDADCEFAFDENSFSEHERSAETVKARTENLRLGWEIQEIRL